MAEYRLITPALIGNKIMPTGTEIEVTGDLGPNLEGKVEPIDRSVKFKDIKFKSDRRGPREEYE